MVRFASGPMNHFDPFLSIYLSLYLSLSLRSIILNSLRPLRAGLNHLQECSQPTAHVDSDDDEFAETQEQKQQEQQEAKGKPVRRLRSLIRSKNLILDVF
jgi:hypothetical protein